MADYCRDCSVDTFGEDTRDLAGLVSAEQVAEGLGAEVLCECCGPILVDHNGARISESTRRPEDFFRVKGAE